MACPAAQSRPFAWVAPRWRRDPRHWIRVIERNRAENTLNTFSWGVVFSDETLGNLAGAGSESNAEITESFAHRDTIDIRYHGELRTSGGRATDLALAEGGLREYRRSRLREDGIPGGKG